MTKAQIKYIQSLGRQKYRKEYNAYLVEGDKNAKEWLMAPVRILQVVATSTWFAANQALLQLHPEALLSEAALFEMEKISTLQTAPEVLLVVAQEAAPVEMIAPWSLFLDRIQDPGNMGTILRTADWFGIRQVICTPDCVEVYNPKVVQATMGSLLRVQLHTMTSEQLLDDLLLPLYATCLSGRDIRSMQQVQPGIIAMGNESRGLSAPILSQANFKITIPRIGSAESLNVAVATGIICAALISP